MKAKTKQILEDIFYGTIAGALWVGGVLYFIWEWTLLGY